MRLLLLLVSLLASPLMAANSNGLDWLPLPPDLSWHADHPSPVGAGLVGRSIAIVVMNGQKDVKDSGYMNGMNVFYWYDDARRPIDFRHAALMVSVDAQLKNKPAGKDQFIIKAQCNLGGLVEALAGNAGAMVMLVDQHGVVVEMQRVSSEWGPFNERLEKLLPTDTTLIANEKKYPATCKPIFDLLKVADVKGALTLCAKKHGADGQAIGREIVENADAMIARDVAVLSDAQATGARRFVARGRITSMLEAFPRSAQAVEAAKALKAAQADPVIAGEQLGWSALQSYLVEVSKAQPKQRPALQQKHLAAILAKFPGTYAATLAGMIRTTARVAL